MHPKDFPFKLCSVCLYRRNYTHVLSHHLWMISGLFDLARDNYWDGYTGAHPTQTLATELFLTLYQQCLLSFDLSLSTTTTEGAGKNGKGFQLACDSHPVFTPKHMRCPWHSCLTMLVSTKVGMCNHSSSPFTESVSWILTGGPILW